MNRIHAFPLVAALALMSGVAYPLTLASFKLEMKDGVVSPQRLVVPAGKKFMLEIKNAGRTAVEFECKPLQKEKVLTPGASALMEIRPLSSGEFRFVDEFHENLPTGMGVIVAE